LVVSFRWPRTSIFVQCAEHEKFGKVLQRREEKVNTSRRLYHIGCGIQYPIAGAQVTLVPPVIARRAAVPGLDPGKQSPAGRAEERSSGGGLLPRVSPGTAPRLAMTTRQTTPPSRAPLILDTGRRSMGGARSRSSTMFYIQALLRNYPCLPEALPGCAMKRLMRN
jgi:hypothetical protein